MITDAVTPASPAHARRRSRQEVQVKRPSTDYAMALLATAPN
jgi:hypothetical protein